MHLCYMFINDINSLSYRCLSPNKLLVLHNFSEFKIKTYIEMIKTR